MPNTTHSDRTLLCKDCGGEFAFTVEGQECYLGRGLYHAPSRCPSCREARRRRRTAVGRGPSGESFRSDTVSSRPRLQRMWPVVCAACGRDAPVPFIPRTDRPVFCDECFTSEQAQRLRSASG